MNDNRPPAFDALLLKYEPYLRKRCSVLVPNDPDAVQEAMCRALERWHKFRPDGSFVSWLNYIVRTMGHESRTRKVAEREPPPNSSHEATQEFSVDIKQIVGRLSPLRAEMVSMIATGSSFVEVAKAQGVSPQSVKERAVRVWNSMRAANDNNKARNAAA